MQLTELNKPEPLAKMAYEALRSSILSNTLTTDVIYNEKKLANQLGISRTPVREALLELSSQGLITFLPRKGVIVRRFTDQDIEEIFELRHIIETGTFRKICSRRNALDFTEIEESITAQEVIATTTRDISTFMDMDRKFHMAFTRLVGNQRLIAIMENIRDILHIMGSHALSAEGRMDKVVEEHKNLLHSVRQGETAKALSLLEDHLDLSKAAVKRNPPPFKG